LRRRDVAQSRPAAHHVHHHARQAGTDQVRQTGGRANNTLTAR
jgi:hypothetical protein